MRALRLLLLPLVVAGVAWAGSSAIGAPPPASWSIQVSGSSFSGTMTNTGTAVIDGIAIGTTQKTANPVTFLTFAGKTCQLYKGYGSAYCYTGIEVKPKQKVSFKGKTRKTLKSASMVNACSTANHGVTNVCLVP